MSSPAGQVSGTDLDFQIVAQLKHVYGIEIARLKREGVKDYEEIESERNGYADQIETVLDSLFLLAGIAPPEQGADTEYYVGGIEEIINHLGEHKHTIKRLEEQNGSLGTELDDVEDDNEVLKKKNARLAMNIKDLKEENEEYKDMVAEVEDDSSMLLYRLSCKKEDIGVLKLSLEDDRADFREIRDQLDILFQKLGLPAIPLVHNSGHRYIQATTAAIDRVTK